MFEASIQDVCNAIQISKDDRVSYLREMEILCNFVTDNLKSRSYEFGQYFEGLVLTGSYLDRVKIKTPDEFDFLVKLVIKNLMLEPIKSNEEPGFIKLMSLNQYYPHGFVNGGYISRNAVQNWMRSILSDVFRTPLHVQCGGRTYRLNYTLQGIAFAHTITASDVNNANRTIKFDLVPCFVFNSSNWPFSKGISEKDWFAVPVASHVVDGDHHFTVCAPHWERELIFDKDHLKDALRLLKAMRDTQKLKQLSSYMLKTLLMHACTTKGASFCQQPAGGIVVAMLKYLVSCFECGTLEFYWQSNINLLDRMTSANKYNCKIKLQSILQVLEKAQRSNSYNSSKTEIMSIFLE